MFNLCRFPVCSTDQKQCIYRESGVCDDFYEDDEDYILERYGDPGPTATDTREGPDQ